MKRFFPVVLLLIAVCTRTYGQNYIYRGAAGAVEDTLFIYEPAVDSSLLGMNILSILRSDAATEGNITVNETESISRGMSGYLSYNMERQITGYRVRIFFDNQRTARAESEAVANAFSEEFPGIAVYRLYENPYFKVTVGDFRTKGDAMKFMGTIKGKYPSVFLVKEHINFPQ